MQKRSVAKKGWLPDLPDNRDFLFSARLAANDLPKEVDLRSQMPDEVYQQGILGSCTACSIALVYQFNLIKQKLEDYIPSRLFIYYNERVVLGTEDEDSGAMLRDGLKSVAKDGAPPEKLWSYNIAKFRDKPPKDVYTEGKKHQAIIYRRLNNTNIDVLKSCLAEGYPFIFGFTAYEDFNSPSVARTGILNMPSKDDNVWGGHAVVCIGYNDNTQRFLCRNSWGKSWGLKGDFTIPYNYVTDDNLADDFWVIKLVEG